jgi:peptidoglycan-associated lipoprotein
MRVAGDAYLVVSDEIQKRCALPNAREEQPRFDAGSSEIKSQAGGVLERLATCLATGPLKGRRIRIEGHTDPRGGEDYNRELGQRRADATKAFLGARGVSTERMNAVSLGLSESKGTDEASWALDRRVEIELEPEAADLRRR